MASFQSSSVRNGTDRARIEKKSRETEHPSLLTLANLSSRSKLGPTFGLVAIQNRKLYVNYRIQNRGLFAKLAPAGDIPAVVLPRRRASQASVLGLTQPCSIRTRSRPSLSGVSTMPLFGSVGKAPPFAVLANDGWRSTRMADPRRSAW